MENKSVKTIVEFISGNFHSISEESIYKYCHVYASCTQLEDWEHVYWGTLLSMIYRSKLDNTVLFHVISSLADIIIKDLSCEEREIISRSIYAYSNIKKNSNETTSTYYEFFKARYELEIESINDSLY